jgi:hypothetical protein
VNKSKSPNAKERPTLAKAAKMQQLPTPRASMTPSLSEKRKNDREANLETVLSRILLPTPTAQDGKNNTLGRSQAERDSLPGYVIRELLPTPLASDSGEKITGKEKQNSLTKIARNLSGATFQLNHRFVAEMMGFPPNWTELPFQNSEENQ